MNLEELDLMESAGGTAPRRGPFRFPGRCHHPCHCALLPLILSILCLGGCVFQRPGPLMLQGEYPVTVHRLDNGLTVAIEPDRTIGLVTLDMWVAVGAGDEPAELAGISHFLEHMLFKGTDNLAIGEYDRRIEEVGGYLNAATSLDYTHYYTVFPSEHFDRVLGDFADVLRNSVLAAGEVERERQVILEEISRKQDSPFGYLFDESFPLMYDSGPYRHPVIGSRESVSAITREQLLEHYQRFYAPGNMFLSIVGDVDESAALGRVKEVFADWERPFRPWRDADPEVAWAPPSDRVLVRDWKEAYFILAFPAPRCQSPRDIAVRDLAEALLVAGRSSRLVRVIQEREHLVSGLGGYFPDNRRDTPLLLYGTCTPRRVHEVRSAIFRELRLLQEEGLERAELERARRIVLNSQLFAMETGRQRAHTYGNSLLTHGNLEVIDEYRREVARAGEAEILAFVREFFQEDNASFFVTRGSSP